MQDTLGASLACILESGFTDIEDQFKVLIWNRIHFHDGEPVTLLWTFSRQFEPKGR